MKAATEELNLTVITIVAIGAVIAFFMTVLWPNIQKSINSSWSDVTDQKYDKNGNATTGMIQSSTGFTFASEDYTITVR